MRLNQSVDVHVGTIKSFPRINIYDKVWACKPLEEVAEVYSAWEDYRNLDGDVRETTRIAFLGNLNKEVADAMQTLANMAAAVQFEMGRVANNHLATKTEVNFKPEMQACEYRNRMRGRYDV